LGVCRGSSHSFGAFGRFNPTAFLTLYREETENAAELAANGGEGMPGMEGPQTLGVSGNQIRQYIRNFDDAYVLSFEDWDTCS
jgi:hypothetical protein